MQTVGAHIVDVGARALRDSGSALTRRAQNHGAEFVLLLCQVVTNTG